MQRISSRLTSWNKRLFPAVLLVALALVVGGSLVTGAAMRDPAFLVAPCVMAAIGLFVVRKLIWAFATRSTMPETACRYETVDRRIACHCLPS